MRWVDNIKKNCERIWIGVYEATVHVPCVTTVRKKPPIGMHGGNESGSPRAPTRTRRQDIKS